MITVEDKGVMVRLRPRTLLTERTKEKMWIAAALVLEELVAATGEDRNVVDEVLTGYIYASVQVCESSGLDFQWLTLADSGKDLMAKFQAYIITKHAGFVQKVGQELFKMNSPFNEVYAPGAVTADPKS